MNYKLGLPQEGNTPYAEFLKLIIMSWNWDSTLWTHSKPSRIFSYNVYDGDHKLINYFLNPVKKKEKKD